MIRELERFGIWAACVVALVAVALGIWVSPGAATLVVAAFLLMLVLAVGYGAVDALFSSHDAAEAAAGTLQHEMAALQREKASILQVLRDLEVERDLGKVSAQDFESLDRQFRDQAIAVMKRIDQDLAAYRKKAEALIARRLGQAPQGEVAKRGEMAGPVLCASCGAKLDPDSVFCKKCGTKVQADA